MSQNTSFLTLLPPSPYLPLSERTGELPFMLTNDYMFKVVLQSDETILCALLCSLLDLTPDDIHSIVITNPFVPGATIKDKDTILDIRLVLNGDRLINLEMQIKNEGDWPERSLCYLCRAFDSLEKGAPYRSVTPAHHIGILNFNLPHVQKQFYSHYFMINETTHEIFNDKLRLSVLNLTQTVLATEHDRQSGLTRWAAAFKATTWEEYQMLAEEDVLFQKVSDALYLISENREIAEQCRRMQEAEARRKRMEEQEAQQIERANALAQRESALAERENTLAERENTLAEQENTLAEQTNALAQQESALAERKSTLAEQTNALARQEHDLTERELALAEKDQALAARDQALAAKQAELEQLMAQLRKYQQE
ncbi:MAG: Rpn family recombination-promoting nuclease/putative transposase [Lachnospiraceae bacterium]|nr:Rpn family recombination-promoting nuclease/putative transposase [Lachnospiraceae bacterium]